MKQTLLTLAIVLVAGISSALLAQTTIGPRLGIIVANQDSDVPGFESDAITGTQGGLFVNIPIGDPDDGGFAIQPELMYVQRGFTNGSTTASRLQGISVEEKYSYIELPIMLQYNFRADALGFFVQAGPYAALALDGTRTTSTASTSVESDIDFDDGFHDVDFGAQIGAGAGLYLGSSMVFLDIRYLLGIQDLNDDEDLNIKTTNNGIGITAGFKIPISN